MIVIEIVSKDYPLFQYVGASTSVAQVSGGWFEKGTENGDGSFAKYGDWKGWGLFFARGGGAKVLDSWICCSRSLGGVL